MRLFRRPRPNEVFTPKSATVNNEMYIPRPELENRIRDQLAGTFHMIIHGESGTGKTWLYQKIFSELKAEALSVNMAIASMEGSLTAAYQAALDREEEATRTGFEEESTVGVTAVAQASTKHKDSYKIGLKAPFEACLRRLREKAGNRLACLVLDNFEQILGNDTIIKQVTDTIVLLDDPAFASYKVKLVVVGVPNNIKTYFSKVSFASTISNRIKETPEVQRLTKEQAHSLIKKGLFTELKYKTSLPEDKIVNHCSWVTDRIAQHIHEYCLIVSQLAERNSDTITDEILSEADMAWVRESLTSDYLAIEMNMNSRDTKENRRNQTIFAAAMCEKEDFKHTDIEKIVRAEFPDSTKGVTLNIPQQLSHIAGTEQPLIKRTPDGVSYRFINPKYKMCARAILRKAGAEKVEKVQFGDL